MTHRYGFLYFFALLSLVSCSGLEPRTQPEPLREVAAIQDQGQEDRLELAYGYFISASLAEIDGQYEEARRFLLMAIEQDPDSAYLHAKMAVVLRVLKKEQGAVEYALKSVALDPGSIENRALLAELYSQTRDDEAAIQEYRKILELEPRQKRARLVLTTLLIRKGQYQAALQELDFLLQQDPTLVIVHYYRGRVYLEMGNHGEAEKAYLEALKLNESMEPALFDLGALYQVKKNYAAAAKIYERLLSFYPANTTVRERLIHMYYKLGENQKAESQLEEIKRQTSPGDPGRQTLGLIYLRHGKLDESISELDLIVNAWPDDDKSRYYLASAYEEKGEHEKALEHFQKIKSGSEYYANAKIHIAYI